jgi:ABC-2 type transport system ATP-binding protein
MNPARITVTEGTDVMVGHTSGAVLLDASLPSGPVLLVLVPVILVVLGLVVFSLVDLVRAPEVKYLPKWAWGLIIVVGSAPFGALAYLILGRVRDAEPVRPAVVDAAHDPTGRLGRPAPVEPDARMAVARADRCGDLLIETDGLTRDYGGTGLFDVDLSIPRGCVYGLVGPNGSGKTTLLSILGGTRHADRGEVRIAVPRGAIAVCPDVPEFDGWLTAAEAVDLARAMMGVDPAGGPVAAALQVTGLADVADRQVGGFSRGMTQRLGLACALVGDPEMLILDEPTSALDPAGRADMLDLVASMRGHRTVVLSTHILADVQRVADQVGILRQGRLLYQGPTQTLIDTRLRPCWHVRIAGDTTVLRAELSAQPWVTRVIPVGPDALRIEATSIEAGERGIPVSLAACRERLISCEPVAADLEAAFLALTTSRGDVIEP